MLEATYSSTIDADFAEDPAATTRATVQIRPQLSALALRDVPSMAGDGRLARVMARRVAGLAHPVKDMAGAVPLELRGAGGRRLSVGVARGAEVRVEARTAGMLGAECLTLMGMAELRALAAVLNAAVAALDVHDELRDFDDDAASILAEARALAGASRKRMPRQRRG